jgi:hypothetical protein
MQASFLRTKYFNFGITVYIIIDDFCEEQLELFTFNCTVHNKLTRNTGNLHVLQSHLSVRQKGVRYMSVKIFNSLPKFLVDLLEDETMVVERLKEILIHNAFYSVAKFLNYCQDS